MHKLNSRVVEWIPRARQYSSSQAPVTYRTANNLGKLPAKYWHDAENKRKFFGFVASQLGIERLDGWYDVSKKTLSSFGGQSLLNVHGSSVAAALKTAFPEHEWLEWRFKNHPRNLWADLTVQRKFFEWAAKQLGVSSLDDWLKVTQRQLHPLGAARLLQAEYHNSLRKALMAVYPEHKWVDWDFHTVSRGFWRQRENRRKFAQWLEKELCITEPAQWYSITPQKVEKIGASELLSQAYSGLMSAAMDLHPDHEWLPWKFHSVTNNYWEALAHRCEFIKWAGKELQVQGLHDWYRISANTVRKIGGVTLLKHRDLIQVLKECYPEHHWQFWKFEKVPNGYWAERRNQRQFLDWVMQQLGVSDMSGWYNVTASNIANKGGSGLLRYYDTSASRAVMTLYPEHTFDPVRFSKPRTKGNA